MIPFKQYITELGDTEAGRLALAQYAGKRIKSTDAAIKRNDERLKQLSRLTQTGDTKRSDSLARILDHDIRKTDRNVTGIKRAVIQLTGHPRVRQYLKTARDIAMPGIKDDD
jgi:hypothetical protein